MATTRDISMTAEQVGKVRAWAEQEGASCRERSLNVRGSGESACEYRRETRHEADACASVVDLLEQYVEKENQARGLTGGSGEPLALSHERVMAFVHEVDRWITNCGWDSAGTYIYRQVRSEVARALGLTLDELKVIVPPKPPGPPPVLLSMSLGDTVIYRAGEILTPLEQRRRTVEAIARLQEQWAREGKDR